MAQSEAIILTVADFEPKLSAVEKLLACRTSNTLSFGHNDLKFGYKSHQQPVLKWNAIHICWNGKKVTKISVHV